MSGKRKNTFSHARYCFWPTIEIDLPSVHITCLEKSQFAFIIGVLKLNNTACTSIAIMAAISSFLYGPALSKHDVHTLAHSWLQRGTKVWIHACCTQQFLLDFKTGFLPAQETLDAFLHTRCKNLLHYLETAPSTYQEPRQVIDHFPLFRDFLAVPHDGRWIGLNVCTGATAAMWMKKCSLVALLLSPVEFQASRFAPIHARIMDLIARADTDIFAAIAPDATLCARYLLLAPNELLLSYARISTADDLRTKTIHLLTIDGLNIDLESCSTHTQLRAALAPYKETMAAEWAEHGLIMRLWMYAYGVLQRGKEELDDYLPWRDPDPTHHRVPWDVSMLSTIFCPRYGPPTIQPLSLSELVDLLEHDTHVAILTHDVISFMIHVDAEQKIYRLFDSHPCTIDGSRQEGAVFIETESPRDFLQILEAHQGLVDRVAYITAQPLAVHPDALPATADAFWSFVTSMKQ